MKNKSTVIKEFTKNLKNDYSYKTITGSFISCCCTVIFSLYNGFLGVYLSSVWHSSICIFYLLLSMIRGSILITENKNRKRPEHIKTKCRGRTFIISSALLMVMNLSLILPISLMVTLEKPVNMGLIPAITMAAYTTYKITLASIYFRREKRNKSKNILITELRTVNFIDAMLSILTLQNTLIMVNKSPYEENSMFPVSVFSSAVIYILIVTSTVLMIVKTLNENHSR